MEILDAHTHVDEAPALGWMDPPEALFPAAERDAIAGANLARLLGVG